MKNTIKCPTCGHEISKNATKCPDCGEPLNKGGISLGSLILIGVVIWFIVSLFTEDKARVSKASPQLTHDEECEQYRKKYKENMDNISYFARQGNPDASIASNKMAGSIYNQYMKECSDTGYEIEDNLCKQKTSRFNMLGGLISYKEKEVSELEEGSELQFKKVKEIDELENERDVINLALKRVCR